MLLYVKTEQDAVIVAERAVLGSGPIYVMDPTTAQVDIQNGTTLVFKDKTLKGQVVRFRDGRSWTPSKAQSDGFLLYRETSSKEKKDKGVYIPNGLVKRTISVMVGVEAYRVINYHYPYAVSHHYDNHVRPTNLSGSDFLFTPSQISEFRPSVTLPLSPESETEEDSPQLPNIHVALSFLTLPQRQSKYSVDGDKLRKVKNIPLKKTSNQSLKRLQPSFDWSHASLILPPLRQF
ncbi:hypothetical protein HDU79_006184 [Rhizoclosmatium sp. JEL0117]|nr:hypothetical protein HDU79_006184 [Rhizoclosmatium sp. JEL0117]